MDGSFFNLPFNLSFHPTHASSNSGCDGFLTFNAWYGMDNTRHFYSITAVAGRRSIDQTWNLDYSLLNFCRCTINASSSKNRSSNVSCSFPLGHKLIPASWIPAGLVAAARSLRADWGTGGGAVNDPFGFLWDPVYTRRLL